MAFPIGDMVSIGPIVVKMFYLSIFTFVAFPIGVNGCFYFR